ncbi:MAG: chemotaxis protein CheW [Candidatus Saccharimonas sp.]|nr:chemotaxis protein CheW [Planctomycetaceae bacterium]
MQIVTFASAGGVHGIPVLAVEEFFRPVPITRVPLADPRVAGLMNQRGKSATVLNLRGCFDKPSGEPAVHPKMILLETDARLTPEAREMGVRTFTDPVVLLVDRILDIVAIDSKALQPRPAHITERFVAGVLRHGDGYVCLLDLMTLIEDILIPKA